MLKSIYVDGLKSLNNFKLDFTTGLNVLIGPNGSGKSNILAALNLVAHSTHLDTLNSRGYVGQTEISELFDIYRKDRKISIAVEGVIDVLLSDESVAGEKREFETSLNYIFEFEIVCQPQSGNKLVFAKQLLQLETNFDQESHQLVFEYGDNQAQLKVADDLYFKNMANNIAGGVSSGLARSVIESIQNRSNFLNYRSAVYELSLAFSPLKKVLSELESGITHNIAPDLIRKNFHKLEERKIKQDGNGLQSVLLEICEKIYDEKSPIFVTDEFYENYQDIYETINFYLKQFLLEFESIRVSFDVNDQKILGKLKFADEVQLPIELLSDGSLKMLALVTILLTKKNLVVLEKPENFLHPRMQKQIIELMRDTLDSQNDVRIFTTHCETIINELEPEEIILTKFKKGKTDAGRLEDPELLRNAICETGLRLGGYYTTRTLDNKRIVHSCAEEQIE